MLAATARYEEARERLARQIDARPDHVEALVLLGKVEYYLGHFRSSRARFEAALLYDPRNMEASFGIQYYRERSLRIQLGLSFVVMLVLLVIGGTLLFSLFRMASAGDTAGVQETIVREAADLRALVESTRESHRVELGSLQSSLGSLDDVLDNVLDEVSANAATMERYADSHNDAFDRTLQELRSISELLLQYSSAQARASGDSTLLLDAIREDVADLRSVIGLLTRVYLERPYP